MDLKKLQARLNLLGQDSTLEEVQEAITDVEFLVESARLMKAALSEGLLEYIDANGEVTIGENRYYVGKKKKVAPRSLNLLVETVFSRAGGDIDRFAEYLASNPFKQGAVKSLVGEGDDFDTLFSTTYELEVKTGKPKREVKKVNEKFLPKKKA